MERFAVIPEGPLHPEHAAVALLVGLLIVAVGGRTRAAGPMLLIGSGVVLAMRQPDQVPEGILDRPVPVVALAGGLLLAATVASLLFVPRRASARTSAFVAGVACTGVWATAPDTEPALIGAVMLAAAVPFVGFDARAMMPVVALVPALAGVTGTVGRPDRLPLVLLVAATAAMAASVAASLGMWWKRRSRGSQRAGTPTTVAPGATSVVTTAPAPTTAP